MLQSAVIAPGYHMAGKRGYHGKGYRCNRVSGPLDAHLLVSWAAAQRDKGG